MKKILVMILVLMLCLSGTAIAEYTSNATLANRTDPIQLTVMLTPQWKGVIDNTIDGAAYSDFHEYAAAEFSKMYPNVTIDVQMISGSERTAIINTLLAAGTPPDVSCESYFTMVSYAHQGALVPLDDIITDEMRADIPESIWNQGRIVGQQFFYPFSHNVGFLNVNTEYLRQAGFEHLIPTEGSFGTWTPEEFYAAMKGMKENVKVEGFYPLSFFAANNQSDHFSLSYLRMFGATAFTENGYECLYNSDEAVRAMELLHQMNEEGLIQPSPESTTNSECQELFNNQKVGVCMATTKIWLDTLNSMAASSLPEFEISTFLFPSDSDPLAMELMYGACVFNSGDELRTAYAKEYVKFISSDDYLTQASATMALPVRTSIAEKMAVEKPYITQMMAVEPYFYEITGGVSDYNGFRNYVFPTFQAVFTNAKEPRQALDDMVENINICLEEGRMDSVLYE